MIGCYQKSGAFGNISGRLVVDIDAAGRSVGARYETGEAPPAVRDCLVALGRARTIDNFDGKPGRLSCIYAGSFIPGDAYEHFSLLRSRRIAGPDSVRGGTILLFDAWWDAPGNAATMQTANNGGDYPGAKMSQGRRTIEQPYCVIARRACIDERAAARD